LTIDQDFSAKNLENRKSIVNCPWSIVQIRICANYDAIFGGCLNKKEKIMKKIFCLVMSLMIAGSMFPKCGIAQMEEDFSSEIRMLELKKDDITRRINAVLDQNIDIRAFTPGVEQKKIDNDQVRYAYKGTEIEDLDKDSLLQLYRNLNQQLAWKDFKKLQKQDKMLKDLKKLSKMPRNMRR